MVEREKVLNQGIIPKGWISTTWEDFLRISQELGNDKAKFYYFQGSYYSEMGVGANHAFINTVLIILISLYR
jgi:hypothetical protein